MSLLTDQDIYLFKEGTGLRAYEHLGSHLSIEGETAGATFAVWAPNALAVSVIGDFNNWNAEANPLAQVKDSGLWECFVPGIASGALYKYHVQSNTASYRADKADPFAFFHQTAPKVASIVWDLNYDWNDQSWMSNRQNINDLGAPMCVYEVHLGSWRRVADEANRFLTYRELAAQLIPYVREMGYTHVEFLPVMEHPFYGSWGYQTTGYFAPTSRYGTPQDFMYLVDQLHQQGIGVILDWVPSHFPQDEHGIGFFDGVHEFEHADPRQGIHPDWNSFIFNYGRNEVRSFLLSSALFWLSQYHIDGLRVDAVASMLYLDYSRKDGEWIPNRFGGRENLEAVGFLRALNEDVYRDFPGTQTIAEESTAWPLVSRPTYLGGLGFGLKWDMGWMHDTLQYLANEPFLRKYHQHELIFRNVYAYNENFVLPLSHDEVVHGKGSLLRKMPGDDWQKFANLRLLFAYMYGQPGKKLLFMGGEFGQWSEWNHDSSLDWQLLQSPPHAGLRLLTGDLNNLYRNERALHENEHSASSFEWIDCHDSEKNVLSFLRKGKSLSERIIVVCNFSPVPRANYRIGAPAPGYWREVLNSDAFQYGGTGFGSFGGVDSVPFGLHGRPHSVTINLPPLGAVFFKLDS